MSSRLFEGLSHAALYAKYRPTYPQQLTDKIMTFMKAKCKQNVDYTTAVDVGCGSGQFTRNLASNFKNVIGVDVSEAQLKFARKLTTNPNIAYKAGSGENIPIESLSVDLVTCAQAAHWMDFSKFCDEVDRVLKPCGCLAVIGYSLPVILYQGSPHDGLNRFFDEYYNIVISPYKAEELQVLDNRYRDLKLPYSINERDDSLSRRREQTLTWLLRYFSTWTPYQIYIKENRNKADPLVQLGDRMIAELGRMKASTDDIKVTLEESVFISLAAKPAHH